SITLKIAKVDVRSNCVCLKLRFIKPHLSLFIYDCSRLTALPKFLEVYFRKQFLFYGKRTTSKIIVIENALNIIFNIYYLRAEVSSDLFVASGEGPKFFQNLHQSINVLLRIYGLIKYFLIKCPFFPIYEISPETIPSNDDQTYKSLILLKSRQMVKDTYHLETLGSIPDAGEPIKEIFHESKKRPCMDVPTVHGRRKSLLYRSPGDKQPPFDKHLPLEKTHNVEGPHGGDITKVIAKLHSLIQKQENRRSRNVTSNKHSTTEEDSKTEQQKAGLQQQKKRSRKSSSPLSRKIRGMGKILTRLVEVASASRATAHRLKKKGDTPAASSSFHPLDIENPTSAIHKRDPAATMRHKRQLILIPR
ncbi:hypothetical protein Avbf_14984, partial [Armadillidium vulgare]